MARKFHVTLALHEWDLLNPDCDLDEIVQSGVTQITLPIIWRRIEPSPGVFDFSKYDKLIVPILQRDLRIIILPDAGGRWDFDDFGNVIHGVSGYPDWFRAKEDYFARDFQG
jgi:hypothetical protein